jgi:hypothetical protein
MTLLDLLSNAAGGGVVGSLLHLGTSWFETYQKKKQTEIEIMLMKAQMEAAANKSAWDSFQASQVGANEEIIVSDKASLWVINLAECVDCFRSATRPLLTWSLLVFLYIVYLKSDPTIRASMTNEITFGSFTALFWWFGSRYSKK